MNSHWYAFNYTAEGRSERVRVSMGCETFRSAVESCKYIMRQLPEVTSACVKDRKGNVLKVIKSRRGGNND